VGRKPVSDSTSHVVVGVALRVREGHLEVMTAEAQRASGEGLEEALARALDVPGLAHVEQLDTRLLPDGRLATVYLGLVPADRAFPGDWGSDLNGDLAVAAQARLRAKLSYTNVGFALAPAVFTISELRELYVAALGHDVSATNLQRVLLRRNVLEPTGSRRASGPTGGRPGALFRFCHRGLEITDQFAVLRPPDR